MQRRFALDAQRSRQLSLAARALGCSGPGRPAPARAIRAAALLATGPSFKPSCAAARRRAPRRSCAASAQCQLACVRAPLLMTRHPRVASSTSASSRRRATSLAPGTRLRLLARPRARLSPPHPTRAAPWRRSSCARAMRTCSRSRRTWHSAQLPPWREGCLGAPCGADAGVRAAAQHEPNREEHAGGCGGGAAAARAPRARADSPRAPRSNPTAWAPWPARRAALTPRRPAQTRAWTRPARCPTCPARFWPR
jgi:hypothetical protein